MADLELLDKSIRRVPDFPKPGILFYDITSVFVNPEAFKYCIDKMVEIYKDSEIEAIAGVDSRGFLFAAPLAEKLGISVSYAYELIKGSRKNEEQKAKMKDVLGIVEDV